MYSYYLPNLCSFCKFYCYLSFAVLPGALVNPLQSCLLLVNRMAYTAWCYVPHCLESLRQFKEKKIFSAFSLELKNNPTHTVITTGLQQSLHHKSLSSQYFEMHKILKMGKSLRQIHHNASWLVSSSARMNDRNTKQMSVKGYKNHCTASSEISDLCEISDLLLLVTMGAILL